MVKQQGASDYDRLDTILRDLCRQHQFALSVTGWSRKTYDIYLEPDRLGKREHLARVESLATTGGEIRLFDDRAVAFAQALGEALEKQFGVAEAVIIREQAPGKA